MIQFPGRHAPGDASASAESPQLVAVRMPLNTRQGGVATVCVAAGKVFHTFASYFDAMIRATHLATPNSRIGVCGVGYLPPGTIQPRNRDGYNVLLQSGWAARQGRLITGPDNQPPGCFLKLRRAGHALTPCRYRPRRLSGTGAGSRRQTTDRPTAWRRTPDA